MGMLHPEPFPMQSTEAGPRCGSWACGAAEVLLDDVHREFARPHGVRKKSTALSSGSGWVGCIYLIIVFVC